MANLSRVIIHNFRNVSFRDITLLSSFGSNVVSGPNMSGKTNTLNAIHWALTGMDMEGNNDNRLNFPITGESKISVLLDFTDFTFERVCEMVDGTPTVSVYINDEMSATIKIGEANLYNKLGLSDLILQQPKGFSIVRFLLNPLYFETISPSALRKFLYKLSNTDLDEIAEKQTKPVLELLKKRDIVDPYKLGDDVAKEKKAAESKLKTCKDASAMFPQYKDEIDKKAKELAKEISKLESEEALAEKYALSVSKRINKYYENAMGIKICILEKGVGDDVYKDVCYPILPKSNLPFVLGSQAEKTYVGLKFINEVCLTWNIKPLVVLLDNMESLDESTTKYVNNLGIQYMGALVR